MSLTIHQLTGIPTLRTRFLAGRSGGDRLVLWAHTCELPDPWHWMGTGDLLLTDGYSFPREATEQVGFLRELAAANLSGLALAEGMLAAPLTDEARAVAEELSFPVLETAYSVPFVSVARTVADGNAQESGRRLHRVLRVYDLMRRSAVDDPRHAALLARIAEEVRCDLAVLDADSGFTPMPPAGVTPQVLAEVHRELLARDGRPMPAISRVAVGEQTALALPLREGDPTVLVAVSQEPSGTPDLVVLQHVVTIVAMEVDRRSAVLLRRRVAGTRMFRQFVEATVDWVSAPGQLDALGLGPGPWSVLAVRNEQELDLEVLNATWLHAGVLQLLLPTERGFLVLVDEPDEERLALLLAGLPSELRVGISRPVVSLARVPDGVREARWALEAAPVGGPATRYGEGLPMFLPSTISEGEAVVDRVLGELLAYDATHTSSLMETLSSYLGCNRSVQLCAGQLGIHKQTVVYRVRRIEEVSGRRFHDLGDLTTLYLAHRTWKMLSLQRQADPSRSVLAPRAL